MLKKPNQSDKQILIVEDEPIIATDLHFEIDKLGHSNVHLVESGEEAIEYVKKNEVHLVLMDIQLAGIIDGVDASHEILKVSDVPIIFLTSNTDEKSFIRAKLTQPFAFLSKPFRPLDLQHTISLALEQHDGASENEEEEDDEVWFDDRFFIRSKEWLIKINVEDLLWIQADGCYCKLQTKDKNHTIISTLKKFETEAPGKSFMRIHRSYMVNLNAIDKISDNYVSVKGQSLPIGKNYKKSLQNTFTKI